VEDPAAGCEAPGGDATGAPTRFDAMTGGGAELAPPHAIIRTVSAKPMRTEGVSVLARRGVAQVFGTFMKHARIARSAESSLIFGPNALLDHVERSRPIDHHDSFLGHVTREVAVESR
jgi:hypothetical protein